MQKTSNSSDYSTLFTQTFIVECKRRLLDEGLVRIKKCLDQTSESDVWKSPNEHSNSIGNLVLHLCGNVRQWILTGMGKQPDTRERDAEFDGNNTISKEALIQKMENLMEEVVLCLDAIGPEDLLKKRKVQGFEETGLSILVHVVEHFSYHVGQITYIVKSNQNIDMGYYSKFDLNEKN